jgi:hypothetical protein
MINIDNHVRGDTLNISFSIRADTVIDLASEDVAFTFSVKQNITDTEYLIHKDKSAVTALGDNSFILRVPPEDTAALAERYYPYDLEFRFGDDVYTLARGNLHIIADVST